VSKKIGDGLSISSNTSFQTLSLKSGAADFLLIDPLYPEGLLLKVKDLVSVSFNE
jgi:hypothetical protein